jgi:hypothetical protein
MKPTIEVRWYFEKEPKNISDWFAQFEKWPSDHNQPLKFKHEWDHSEFYLNLGTFSKMSFKVRDGKSEIKVLDKLYGPKVFSNYAIGNVEKWIKWSLAFEDSAALPSTIFSSQQEFYEIKKERLLLKYEFPNAGTFRRIDPSKQSNNSLQVELSRIGFNDKEYFSFNLEMGSENNLRLKNFYQISNSIFSEMNCQNLNAANSYRYPSFIQLYKQKID